MSENGTTTMSNEILEPTPIEWPDADFLDRRDEGPDYDLKIYMVPSLENEGVIGFETFSGYGDIGWPIESHRKLWYAVGWVHGPVIGESVLAWLREHEELIRALDDCYLGSENGRGHWGDDAGGMECEIEPDPEDLRYSWDAGDYMTPAGESWDELAAMADVDPGATGDDLVRAIDAVVAMIHDVVARESDVDYVRGLDEYVTELASEWAAAKDGDDDE